MSTQRPRRITRDTVERLLDGDRGAVAGHHALARVLTVAAATARPSELAGEPACLAAYRAAHLLPATQPRRNSMIKSAVTKLLTVKAAAILAGAAASGGLALAASTGSLPDPFTTNVPAASASASPGHGKSDTAKGKANAADKSAEANEKDGPSPSLVGLCHAYSAGNKAEHGKALESPAFKALIQAAGGNDKVDAFCDTLLASAGPDASKSHPNGSDNTDHPKGGSSDHSNGAPSDRPHGKPSESTVG
jgi:hypothetical protein